MQGVGSSTTSSLPYTPREADDGTEAIIRLVREAGGIPPEEAK